MILWLLSLGQKSGRYHRSLGVMDMFENDDFMNFMGYRYMIVEDKIEECLSAACAEVTANIVQKEC